VALNSAQVVTSGDAGDIVSRQAEFDGQIATDGTSTDDGYAQKHVGVKSKEVDMRRMYESKGVCKGRRIVILN